MKRMLSLPLIAVAALLLLQGITVARAATDTQASTPTPSEQPIIVAWDRVGTPA